MKNNFTCKRIRPIMQYHAEKDGGVLFSVRHAIHDAERFRPHCLLRRQTAGVDKSFCNDPNNRESC